MSGKTKFKLIFDLAMFITFIMMYSKNVISMMFHEAAGTAVLCMVLIHLIINGDWIKAVSKKAFSAETNARTRALWITDFFLVINTAFLIVTALLVSKKIFTLTGNHESVNPFHFFAAACFLVLLGIHCGLHFTFIRSSLCAHAGKNVKGVRIALAVSAVCFAGFGVYNIAATSYTHWIAAPFVSYEGMEHRHEGEMPGNMQIQTENASVQQKGTQVSAQQNMPRRPQQPPVTAGSILLHFVRFLSIAWLFAFCAYAVDCLCAKKRLHN